MRIVASLVVACLATVPATFTASEATPTATAAATPAVNIAFAAKALQATDTVVQACQANLDAAKAVAATPLAGKSAKKKVNSAQGAVDVATGLKTDLTAVAAGNRPAADGILGKLAASQMVPADKPSPSPLEKLKAIPGAQTVIDVLSTPGVPAALVSALPLDSVPGYKAAAAALGLAAP